MFRFFAEKFWGGRRMNKCIRDIRLQLSEVVEGFYKLAEFPNLDDGEIMDWINYIEQIEEHLEFIERD